MPPVVAAIASVAAAFGASAATAAAIGLNVTIGLITTGATYVIGGVARALQKRPTDNANALARTVSIRQAAAARRFIYGLASGVGGIITFANTRGPKNLIVDLVITLTGHEVDSIDEMYFDGEQVEIDGSGDGLGKWAGYVHIQKNLGTDGQSAFSDLMAASPDVWTSNHRQRGCAGVYVSLDVSNDQLTPGGRIPNITFNVHGKKVYDPRTNTTAWSENAALIVADYLVNTRFGLGADYSSEIDEDALMAAANICDEVVELDTASPPLTERRYHINGVSDFEQEPGGVLEQMMGAMAGYLVNVGGKWVIVPGAFRLAVLELTDDDFIQSLQVQTKRSARDLFNGVKGTFISPNHNNQQTDFPVVSVPGYVTEDSSVVRWKDINLPWTRTEFGCQRLARIDLERNRRQVTVECVCKMRAYELIPGDVVEVTHARFGWDHKEFEVAEARLSLIEDNDGNNALGVALTLREVDLNVYGFLVDDYGEMIDARLLDLENRKVPFTWNPSAAVKASGADYTFGLAQRYLDGADGTAIPQLQITGKIPVNVFSESVPRPRTRDLTGATASTGGHISGDRTLYMAVCGQDTIAGGLPTGRYTMLSEIVRVVVPAGTDTNTITIENLIWPMTNAGWVLFVGEDPFRLSRQIEYSGSVPSQATVTGPNARPTAITYKGYTTGVEDGYFKTLIGAPDARFDHLKIVANEQVHGGVWGGEIVSITETVPDTEWEIELNPSVPFDTNVFAGRKAAMIAAPLSEDQWNLFGASCREVEIDSNDGTTLTVSSDPDALGMIVGAVLVIRTLATAVGSDSDGNYIEDSAFGQGGQFLGDADPNVGGGDDSLIGMIIRIIEGTGAGHQYTITKNLGDGSPAPTARIYIHGDWHITPDTTSVFIVINANRLIDFLSEKLRAEDFNAWAVMRINVSNLARKQIRIAAISVSENGYEAPELSSPNRDLWIYGQGGDIGANTVHIEDPQP